MNILVTGANGQLGNEMRIVSKNTTDHYLFTDVNQVEGVETTYLDITDMDAIRKMVSENHIDAIINCAAWTNVDACETDEKLAALAEKLNADAPENLAKAMKEVDGLLIQISTDYVFGKEPYNVPCNPDQKGTPTYALDLANAIITILDKVKAAQSKNEYVGVYHFSNEGVCSWYDFTQMIARIAGHTECDIQPCYSLEYPSPVTRPAYSVLDKRTIKETFGVKVPYWVDSLEKCIANLKEAK